MTTTSAWPAEGGRIPVLSADAAREWHDDPTICSSRERVDEQHRARPAAVRHALVAAHQGHPDLPQTGNLRAVQILLGHTKIESTVRYLGIEVDDALAIAEQIDI